MICVDIEMEGMCYDMNVDEKSNYCGSHYCYGASARRERHNGPDAMS